MAEYTYQWKRNGVPIVGAKNFKYVLTEADSNAYVSCYVTKKQGNGSRSVEKGVQTEDINISTITNPILGDGGDLLIKSKDYSSSIYNVKNYSFSGYGISVVFAYYVNDVCIALVSEMDVDTPVFWSGVDIGDKVTCVVRVANKWRTIEVPAAGSITIIQ